MTKVLIISSMPPTRCGVGAYAHEQRLALQRAGRIVCTLSPDRTSAASVRCDFRTLRGLLAAMRYACLRRWDEVHMHFTDALMMPRPASRATFVPTKLLQAALLGLLGLRFGARFHLVCHENALARRQSVAWRLARSVAYWPQRAIEFHTARDQAAFLDYFGAWVDERHTRIVDPGRFMVSRFPGGRAAARARLQIAPGVIVALCIGLVKRNKGFDDLVAAAAASGNARLSVYVVGADDTNDPEAVAYADELTRTVAAAPNAAFVRRFVSDEEFDCWVTAADCVVLPYRVIFSSSVAARARLLGTPILYRDLPNLCSQLDCAAGATPFRNVADLATRLAQLAPPPGPAPADEGRPGSVPR